MEIPTNHTYNCYECGNPVTLEELLRTDTWIEGLPEKTYWNFAGYYGHCGGEDRFFHANHDLGASGMVNVCGKCSKRVVDYYLPA